MILKSLRVERFAGLNPGASIERFGPDITVIHGPNGAGKSTLFRALTYALYQRHGLLAQDALAQIVPRGREVSPRVEVTFEIQGTAWRLGKQFFRKADVELSRLENGVFVSQAQGVAAEDQLRELLGSGKNLKGLASAEYRGIGEILLVDQGDVRMTAVSPLARDRLRLVIDQVGTTQGAHEILAAVEKRYTEVFGKAGDVRERSTVSQLEEEIRRLEAGRDELRAQIALADELAQKLLALEAESPDRMKEEIARIDAELEVARARTIEVVQHRARREGLAKDLKRMTDEAARLRSVCADLKSLRATGRRLARDIAGGDVRWRELNETHQKAIDGQREAEDDLNRTLGQDRVLGDRDRAVRDARAAFELVRRLPDLEERVTRYVAARDQIAEAEKATSARLRPSEADMTRIRTAFNGLRDLERAAQLLDFRVAFTAEAAISVENGAERIDLQPNESKDIVSGGGLELRIPGVARIGIRAPGGLERSRVQRELDEARHAVYEIGLKYGTGDLDGIEALARDRTEIEGRLQSLRAAKDGVFKDEAQAKAAQAEIGASRATLAELVERRPEWKGCVPDLASIAQEDQALEKERQYAADAQNTRTRLLEARRDHARRAVDDLKRHEKALDVLKLESAGCEGRVASLESDGLSDHDRERLLAAGEAAGIERERDLAVTNEALEVLGDPDVTIKRLGDERRSTDANQKLSEERRIRVSEQLDRLRDKGLWQAMADLEIELGRTTENLARERLAADALKLLRDVLVREQATAVEAAVRPVADRVTRMARFLFGAGSQATFGEQLAPQALVAGGSELPVGLLSAGTQDQLALLTRIALGELYAEKYGRHAFVLDDPLVNCDRERRGRLLELLSASRSLQIVIFTCSPELYRGLPEEKTVFLSVEEAKKQVSSAASVSA